MKDIVINGNGVKVKKLVELENALLDSQKRLTNVETTNEVLRKELDKVTQKVDLLDKYLNFGDAVETKEDAQRLIIQANPKFNGKCVILLWRRDSKRL